MKLGLVTGGTRGLGRAISLALAGRGRFVVAVYRRDDGAAARMRDELTARSLPGIVIRHDLAGGRFQEALAANVDLASFHEAVVIHNAAEPFEPKPAHLVCWEELASQLATSVRGGLEATLAVLPAMVRSGGGTIVSVLSDALQTAPKGFASYVVAKSALEGWTRALAGEVGPRGVRVFSVSPGFMDTAYTTGWDSRFREAIVASHGPPEDVQAVADRIVALVDDPATPGRGENHRV